MAVTIEDVKKFTIAVQEFMADSLPEPAMGPNLSSIRRLLFSETGVSYSHHVTNDQGAIVGIAGITKSWTEVEAALKRKNLL